MCGPFLFLPPRAAPSAAVLLNPTPHWARCTTLPAMHTPGAFPLLPFLLFCLCHQRCCCKPCERLGRAGPGRPGSTVPALPPTRALHQVAAPSSRLRLPILTAAKSARSLHVPRTLSKRVYGQLQLRSSRSSLSTPSLVSRRAGDRDIARRGHAPHPWAPPTAVGLCASQSRPWLQRRHERLSVQQGIPVLLLFWSSRRQGCRGRQAGAGAHAKADEGVPSVGVRALLCLLPLRGEGLCCCSATAGV